MMGNEVWGKMFADDVGRMLRRRGKGMKEGRYGDECGIIENSRELMGCTSMIWGIVGKDD